MTRLWPECVDSDGNVHIFYEKKVENDDVYEVTVRSNPARKKALVTNPDVPPPDDDYTPSFKPMSMEEKMKMFEGINHK